MFVDFNNNRVRELALGRSVDQLESFRTMKIKGRENVKNVVIDMSGSFKMFVHRNFPSAIITTDKFHVIKLVNHTLNKIRIDIMKHPIFMKSRTSPMRRLYLTRKDRLDFTQRSIVSHINGLFPELEEIYDFKERLLLLLWFCSFELYTSPRR